MKPGFKKILPIVILLIAVVLGIFIYRDNVSDKPSNSGFDAYTEGLFCSMLSSDTLSLHFYVKDPKAFGIKNLKQSFGDYSYSTMTQTQSYYIKEIESLCNYDYKSLSKNQQLTYDVLLDYFRRQLDFGDLCICSQSINSVTGVQAQLPILLSEYKFYSKKDIVNYLNLLKELPDYFDSICSFQKTKASNGYYMNKSSINSVISQCSEFERYDSKNILCTSFKSKISKCKFLSSAQKKKYVEKNVDAFNKYIIPSYKKIISTMNYLKEKKYYCKNKGLCKFPSGRDYYEYLIKSIVGSDRDVNEIKTLIREQLISDMRILNDFFKNHKDLEGDFIKEKNYSNSYKQILKTLLRMSEHDFTKISGLNYSVKKVNKSLAPYLSPAFYLSSPIDSDENIIYINESSNSGQDIFSLLAHEGIPGHMYQTEYFKRTKPPAIRHVINYGGYTEGWATYVEFLSYSYNYDNEVLADSLRANADFSLALYSLCDIGINYDGWSKKNVLKFLGNYGIDDEALAENIFEAVSQDPCNYLQYYLGYLEIENLKDYMKSLKGDNFSLKKFHNAFLKIGPASFPVVKKWLPYYY